MKTAILDIGSNSVRYALFTQSDSLTKKELNSTVLADGLFFSGTLKREAILRTVDAIEKFCNKAKSESADKIILFATEAVRSAKNGSEFTSEVYKRVGLNVNVIEGSTEGKLGFWGAIEDYEQDCTVFDIGGASCEIVCGKCSDVYYCKSFPIGCVRLHDGSQGNRQKAQELIKGALPSSIPDTKKLIGIGGTATALGAMLWCPDAYDPHKVHKSVVTQEFLQKIATEFFGGENLNKKYPSLTTNRARVIGYGALAALYVLKLAGKTEFYVSEKDNMEGALRLYAK